MKTDKNKNEELRQRKGAKMEMACKVDRRVLTRFAIRKKYMKSVKKRVINAIMKVRAPREKPRFDL